MFPFVNQTHDCLSKKMVYICRRTIGRHYFFNRIVRLWNALPELDLEKPVVVLKFELTQFVWDAFILWLKLY